MLRWLPVAAVVAVLTPVAGGCSGGGGPTPDDTVRAYVDAINARDGKGVCNLITVEGAYEFVDWLTEESYADESLCPDYVAALIGRGEEADTDTFRAARILELRAGERVGDVRSMNVRVELELNEQGNEQDRITKTFDDVVWLVERDGRWLLAKPSGVLLAAFAAYTVPDDLLEAPDPVAQQKEYERKVAAESQRQEAERASFADIGASVDECGGVETAQDDVGSDLSDWSTQGLPDVDRKLRGQLAMADLRRVEVRTQGEELCVRFTVGDGDIEEVLRLTFEIYSPAKSQVYGSALDLLLEVRADGKARFGYEDKNVEDEYARHPFVAVPARLGRQGATFTFRVERGDLPDRTRYFAVPDWDGFLWGAVASTEIEVDGSRRSVSDFLHEHHAAMTSHPGGRTFSVYDRLERELPTG